jgi:methionine synthase II (cobalamin-independent)
MPTALPQSLAPPAIRAVVTGVGPLSAIGAGRDDFFDALMAGRHGFGPITLCPADDSPSKIAAEVKNFDLGQFVEKGAVLARHTPRPVQFALAAAVLALHDSELDLDQCNPDRFGVHVGTSIGNDHYGKQEDLLADISNAMREELLELSGAGCPVIQMEEPNIHLIGIQRGGTGTGLGVDFFVNIFNNTVRGLREKTEVWCHTCWGNPAQQRLFATNQSYKDALPHLNKLDVDVITFECCTSDGMDLELIGREITDKKIAIGVVNHRDLQVERPEQVADLIRRALEHIPAERLILSSDCGFGREGMSRRIAFFKMVSIVRGTNIVRRELGLPEAPCLAADARYAIADVIE